MLSGRCVTTLRQPQASTLFSRGTAEIPAALTDPQSPRSGRQNSHSQEPALLKCINAPHSPTSVSAPLPRRPPISQPPLLPEAHAPSQQLLVGLKPSRDPSTVNEGLTGTTRRAPGTLGETHHRAQPPPEKKLREIQAPARSPQTHGARRAVPAAAPRSAPPVVRTRRSPWAESCRTLLTNCSSADAILAAGGAAARALREGRGGRL